MWKPQRGSRRPGRGTQGGGTARGWEPGPWALVFVLPLTCCVTLSRWLALSGPRLSDASAVCSRPSQPALGTGTAWPKAFQGSPPRAPLHVLSQARKGMISRLGMSLALWFPIRRIPIRRCVWGSGIINWAWGVSSGHSLCAGSVGQDGVRHSFIQQGAPC